MAEITYRAPGFFESEIDLSIVTPGNVTATPAGVIGPTPIGPAFVPVTVTSVNEFKDRFFGTSEERNNSYFAAQEFFRYGNALTFVRTLGVGANRTAGDIQQTQTQGTAKGAGFVIKGTPADDGRLVGATQFLVASHNVSSDVDASYPIFVDNDSFDVAAGGGGTANLVRGVLLFPTGTRGMVLSYNQDYSPVNVADDAASIDPVTTSATYQTFKLVISSSASSYGSVDGYDSVKVFTASLNPASPSYISKVLNTSPDLFEEKQHLLYLDFAVENEIASVATTAGSVAILSGSAATSDSSGDATQTFADAFGRFDARFSPARTTSFISQPYGSNEYDLFHFETLGDGTAANTQFKISISNIRRSLDINNQYGTFDVIVRDFYDTDFSPVIYEQFVNCTLNPDDQNYIARKIGDKKVYFNFDAVNPLDRNFVSSGKYPNNSTRVRVIMAEGVQNKTVPVTALPFGFRGLPTLKFTDGLTDHDDSTLSRRLAGLLPVGSELLTGSIAPPVPMRYKVTIGSTDSTPAFQGEAGTQETANANLYWGIKFEKFPSINDVSSATLQSNYITENALNPLVESFARFSGIQKLDVLLTGSAADSVCNDKFSLANVALYNSKGTGSVATAINNNLTGTLDQHMVNAIYVRNATPDPVDGTITDGSISGRLTLASLASTPDAFAFNRFSPYIKFTNMFYGGFDGLNALDTDMRKMNDRATSSAFGGKAIDAPDIGLNIAANNFTSGQNNALVSAYRSAADIITNSAVSRVNIVTIPGIRSPDIAEYTSAAVRNYARAIYLMDIPAYTDVGDRIFGNELPDVNYTIREFASRSINNNYVATYFPDGSITDNSSPGNKRVRVPASIIALGALAQNDSKTYPWYAPAGFNRAALASVVNLAVRLSSADRDSLYDARINPITSFPGLGYVIFGQKTLQVAKTALDRVNVRRLLIELARAVTAIGLQFVFEPNTPGTRTRFVSLLTPYFSTIQSQSGIDSFRIIMNESNNTSQDIEANRLNGTIIIVPTKAVEYISIDFIITNAGVEFV